jgi:transcriptional regulator with XRE-family HTH domain
MHLKDVFVQNLKKYRASQGISQARLAHLCDSVTSYIGQIEIGNKFPSIDMIDRMAKALNIRPYLFFVDEIDVEGHQEKPPPPQPYAMPDVVKEELIQKLTNALSRVVRRQ